MKPKQQHTRHDDSIQLKQRIIHFQSEIASYENKIKSLQAILEKEKVRNSYLQEKLYSLEEEQVGIYLKEIHSLKEQLLQTEVALEEEKQRAAVLQKKVVTSETKKPEEKEEILSPKPSPSIQAHFAYSLILPNFEEEDKETTIFGDFILKNNGTVPLHDIIVCIKITPIDAGNLSGKIATKSKQSESYLPNTPENNWQFLHDNWKEKIKENGEYWITYIDPEPIKPGETIYFSQFDIQIPIKESTKSTIVDGYVYSKEIPKGVFSLNKIIIN